MAKANGRGQKAIYQIALQWKTLTKFEETAGIILTNCRIGDRLLGAGEKGKALVEYQKGWRTAVEVVDDVGLGLVDGRITALENQKTPPHPSKPWQPYDDTFRISLLFNDAH